MTANAIKPTDVEIMMFLDGELDGEEAKVVERFLEGNDEAASVAASIGQLSELVRGSVDLEADAAEDKLAGLWAGIDSAIRSNGVSKDAPSVTAAATPSAAPVVSIQAKAEERATEVLVEKAGWFGGWQSHVMIGALAAAAALLIMYTQRADTKAPAGVAERQNNPNPNGQVGTRPNQPSIVPVVLRSNAPEVEELEVYDGSGVIMTVASDAESDDAASAVIWISSDTDLVADPI
tara:strand:+ start:128977 stop:129681 length:705 start_codon:yes stop_codon:yes gene_type:complete